MSVGTRILTVEDDERIRTAVRLALEDEGWTVDEAESGEDAVAIFQTTPPDVVLIDIMLPGMDGFELCRGIRRSSDVPVVMVTARNDTHDIVAGLEAGADDDVVYGLSLPICGIVALQMQAGLDGFLAIEKHLLVKRGLFRSDRRRGPLRWSLDPETAREVERLFDRLTDAVATAAAS